MRIAILYICLGNYYVMWKGFYQSSKKYLFTDKEKHYFCFTDNDELLNNKTCLDVSFIRETNYGWPGNTLYRFRMFDTISNELQKFDYVYFFNANAFFVTPLSDELLPHDGATIVATQHFNMINKDPIFYSYDRNKKSTAYVPWGKEGKDYVQACLIGSTASEMIKMSKELSNNIAHDEKNGVIAKWHDESHFNKYIIGKQYNLLSRSYSYAEVLHLPIDVKVLLRRKEQFGNLEVLRYGKKNIKREIMEKIQHQIWKVDDFFHFILKKLNFYK